MMLVRTFSLLLLVVVLTQATPVTREQRQFGFFNPWTLPGPDYDESAEDLESKADYPDYTNLGSMLQSMQAMMTRMRQQLAQAVNRFPNPIPNRPFSPIDAGFDSNKPANTSSVTKVINGHKVTVNETTYSSGDEGGNSHHVFRIKTVDISPHKEESVESIELTDKEESKEVSNESTPKPSSTSSSEDNEIPQKREGKILHEAEWQDDIPEDQFTTTPTPIKQTWAEVYAKWARLPKFTSKWRKHAAAAAAKSNRDERNHHPDVELIPDVPITPIDLSSDLRVNQILSERADAGALILPDPDSEFIELKDGKFVPSIQVA